MTKHFKHVAIIMDGNGRWATHQNMPRLFGHQAGAKRIREIIGACPALGITHLTLFAFSTENWKRTQEEVSGLMTLFRTYIAKETRTIAAKGVRVRFIGDRHQLDDKLVALMNTLEKETEHNTALNLTLALNYGGRDEVARACKRMAQAAAQGKLDPEKVNEDTLTSYLDTCALPDPDFVIRTSGEARISNFLLWQSAYAEYEFVDTLWPDFTADIFKNLVTNAQSRTRRFGGVSP